MKTIGLRKKCLSVNEDIDLFSNGGECCNPSLGLATKARAYKGAGQEEA